MQNPQSGPPTAPTARRIGVAAGELAVVAAVGLAAVWGGTRAGVGVPAAVVVTAAAAAAALSRLWAWHAGGGPVAPPVFEDGPAAAVPQAVVADDAGAADARNGFAGIARRLQAAVNQQLTSLREMQTRHGDQPEVFADLLHLDHGVSLIGRLADSLAVLGGVRQGRQWDEPVALMGVVRGAMSRIVDYRRVDMDGLVGGSGDSGDSGGSGLDADGVAVRAELVEPMAHALAELLDNATRYSPPDTRVAVSAHRAGDGLVVIVADAGVGLTPTVLRQAALALAGSDNALMRTHGAPRLGLTVVGRLAGAHGFQVALEPGAGGGATARVFLPASLLTVAVEASQEPVSVPAPSAAARSAPRRAASPGTPSVGAGGLPQRRRWSPGEAGGPPPGPAPNGAGATLGWQAPRDQASYDRTAHDHAAQNQAAQNQDPYEDQAGLWLGAFRAGEDGQRS